MGRADLRGSQPPGDRTRRPGIDAGRLRGAGPPPLTASHPFPLPTPDSQLIMGFLPFRVAENGSYPMINSGSGAGGSGRERVGAGAGRGGWERVQSGGSGRDRSAAGPGPGIGAVVDGPTPLAQFE